MASGKKRTKKNSNYKYDGGIAEAKQREKEAQKRKPARVKPVSASGQKRSEGKSSAKTVNIILIVFACVAAAGIIAGVIFGIISLSNNRAVNYYKDNLGRYIYIAEEDYASFEVENTATPVTDMSVEQAVLELLCANKGEALNEKNNVRWLTLTPGDEIMLRYIGYTLDENGNRVYFDGGCNFKEELDDEEDKYEFGSGNLILGFELGMLGKNTKDYAFLERYEGGTVQAGDVIYLTYTVFKPDGSYQREVSEYVDLSSPLAEERFGKGFTEYFVGKHVGSVLTEEGKDGEETESSFTTTLEDGEAIYTDMTVNMTFRIRGGERLTVEGYFPKNYSEESLQGVTAYFDVFVERGIEYEAPEYNDSFVTDTLKISKEELAKYEGDTPSERYLGAIRAQLEEAYEAELRELKEQAILDGIYKAMEIKKLPKGEVEAYYNSYLSELQSEFETVGMTYGYDTLDHYAEAVYGLDDGEDWRALLRLDAEETVKNKLAFHYLCNEEGITLSEEEWQSRAKALEDEYLASALINAGITEDKYETRAEYEEKVEQYRANMLEYYGEGFFEYEAYYIYAMDCLVDRVIVK